MALNSSSLTSRTLYFDPFTRTQTIKPISNRRMFSKTSASRREADNYGGRIVDENLIVLRKRIHEMKMVERNYEPPRDWMDWEKRVYTSYDAVICDAMVNLQSFFMETRPSLALGIIAVIVLSVPTSIAVVVYNLLELGKGALSGFH